MLILIENGELYAPEPAGLQSLLIASEKILKVGQVDRRALDGLHVDYEVIDAKRNPVIPGLIDPHEHLLGGSGEKGFATQTPPIHLSEIVTAGITTVVGCLGVDTTMKTLAGLLAHVKGLNEEGMTAFLWTGGYNVPPTTILKSSRDDILFVAEVLGVGEVAIADERSTDPRPEELARLVSDAYCGGLLSRKAGVTHFHVGPRASRLALLRTLLDDYDVKPGCLYPTHVARNEGLLREAIDLTKRGMTVDIDTTDNELPRWLRIYRESGNLERLTISTDASITSPRHLLDQIAACVAGRVLTLEQVLPLATSNPARVLKLANKGRLQAGRDADVLILDAGSLAPREVIARGRRMVRDGTLVVHEHFLADSDRTVHLDGEQRGAAPSGTTLM